MERGSIYPSWRYHRTEEPVLCTDAAHDAELGDDWNDTNVWPDASEPDWNKPVDEPKRAERSPTIESEVYVVSNPLKRGRKPKA